MLGCFRKIDEKYVHVHVHLAFDLSVMHWRRKLVIKIKAHTPFHFPLYLFIANSRQARTRMLNVTRLSLSLSTAYVRSSTPPPPPSISPSPSPLTSPSSIFKLCASTRAPPHAATASSFLALLPAVDLWRPHEYAFFLLGGFNQAFVHGHLHFMAFEPGQKIN